MGQEQSINLRWQQFIIKSIIGQMKQVKRQIIKQQARQQKSESWQGAMIPAAKVSPQVIQILRNKKVPELIIPSHTTIPGAAQIYFTEYLKLFSINRKLNADLIQIFQQRNRLAEKYNELKRSQNECQETIRRKRRFANEIKRDFSCPSPNCHKSYGSQGSLTQHVKLKHQNFYRSGEYQILLQNMLDEMAKSARPKREQPQSRQKTPTKIKIQKQKIQHQQVKIKKEQTAG